MAENNDKEMNLQSQIIMLKDQLTADTSEIGDYKITKTYEARLQNKTDPYDTSALIKKRQEVRDKINELQNELAAINTKQEG